MKKMGKRRGKHPSRHSPAGKQPLKSGPLEILLKYSQTEMPMFESISAHPGISKVTDTGVIEAWHCCDARKPF
jgi:hypothetical protein